MARTKRGVTTHARHKKVLDMAKGYVGRANNNYRIALEKVEKGLQYAYDHRRLKKRFKLVTMGRSFHWMDRERVLTALDGMVDADGGVVMVNDSCLVRPVTAWQRAVEDLQPRFLPPGALPSPSPASAGESHESVLSRSPFPDVQRVIHEFTREWTVDRIIGYLYSTSLPLRRLLGDRRAAFEQEVAATLLAVEPSGRFIEPVSLEVHTATRGKG